MKRWYGDDQRVIDVNLKGMLNGCHIAFPFLQNTKNSRVINMCSASALHDQPELTSYLASKAAVRSLTEALDIELRRHGIRLVDLFPLFGNTATVTDEVSRMKTVSILGVRLRPEDVANRPLKNRFSPCRQSIEPIAHGSSRHPCLGERRDPFGSDLLLIASLHRPIDRPEVFQQPANAVLRTTASPVSNLPVHTRRVADQGPALAKLSPHFMNRMVTARMADYWAVCRAHVHLGCFPHPLKE